MDKRIRSLACGLLAASALVAPQAVLARPASSVEARLDRLEAELTALRGDLAQSRSEAAAATRRAEAAEARANHHHVCVQGVVVHTASSMPAGAPATPWAPARVTPDRPRGPIASHPATIDAGPGRGAGCGPADAPPDPA